MPHGRKADGLSDSTVKPHEPAQVDWEEKYNELKADARKWEDRSKSNYDDLQKAQAELGSAQSRITELETTNTELTEKVNGFQQSKERADLVNDVAKAAGVDPAALAVVRGETKEELEANAAAIKSSFGPSAPVVEGQAKTPGEAPTDPAREAVRGLFGNND